MVWYAFWYAVCITVFDVVLAKSPCALNWLHPPRTPANFCLSVQHACNEVGFLRQAELSSGVRMAHGCATLEPEGSAYGNRFHRPVDTADLRRLQTFVVVLRPPGERMLSHFCEGPQGHQGLTDEQAADLRTKVLDRRDYVDDEAVLASVSFYLAHSYSRGCYVRMLTGSMCSDADVVVDQELTDRAIKNLDQFLFVGTSENYTATVDAFLRTVVRAKHIVDPTTFVGGETSVSFRAAHRRELQMKGQLSHNVPCEQALDTLLLTGQLLPPADPFDQQVYDHARTMFATQYSSSA